MNGFGRRSLVQAAIGAAALTACAGPEPRGPERGGLEGADAAPVAAVDPHGSVQAGIVRPAQQRFVQLVVLDRGGRRPTADLLDDVGVEVQALAAGRVAAVPDPGDVTVTVGVGMTALPAALVERTGLAVLPAFARDRFDARHDGGDLVLQVCASDPVVALTAAAHLSSFLGGELTPRWSQPGFVGAPGPDGVGRNLLGFHDGVVQPAADEVSTSVWRKDRSTLLVVRRIVLDVDVFERLPVAHQEAVVGRRKRTGAPLSGGSITTPLDLAAKTPAGAYLIPAGAHVRRAHPLATGRPLMLRRGYSFAGADERGLLFLSFQSALDAFVQTQYRMDAGDDLAAFTRVTASGAFWVLPGFDTGRGLGSGLRALA